MDVFFQAFGFSLSPFDLLGLTATSFMVQAMPRGSRNASFITWGVMFLLGYQGIISGMDPRCCESEEWAEVAGVNQLTRGKNQPFYQVCWVQSRHALVLRVVST